MKSGEQKNDAKTIRIDSLPLDQLRMLQKQVAQELEGRKKAAQVLASTASSFASSRSAVEDLSKVDEGMALAQVMGITVHSDRIMVEHILQIDAPPNTIINHCML